MSLPTFVTSEPFQSGQTITLGEDEAHHMRVRRLAVGCALQLLDGQGARGTGVLVRVAKRHAAVQVEQVMHEGPPPPVHLLLPVADRDRMLWLAEKATELAATSWRPVLWKRSRSVTPRGEGPAFQQKVAARMAGALEQSGGTWLPSVYPDATPERAIAATPDGIRLALDGGGESMMAAVSGWHAHASTDADEAARPVTLAVGPEGGFEDEERTQLRDAGFRVVSLGHTILRFETAAVAALAIARTARTSAAVYAHLQQEHGHD